MLDPSLLIENPATRVLIPTVALGFIVLEYALRRLGDHDKDTHDLSETAASVGVAMGQKVVRVLEAGVLAVPFVYAYDYRVFDFSQTSIKAILALFICLEFVYYWHHRAAHRIRWMWATHSVHHSATKFNLSAAIRLGWTGNISGNFLFFLPLAFIGFHPISIVAMLGVNLVYQFFIHTELPFRFGPLEWVLNTPTHHRVHHASNTTCLDKNFGGVLIVFDRLFGSYAEAPKGETLTFGLVGKTQVLNPFRIAFGEWISIFRDFQHVTGWRRKLRVLFAPPGPPVRRKSNPSHISANTSR